MKKTKIYGLLLMMSLGVVTIGGCGKKSEKAKSSDEKTVAESSADTGNADNDSADKKDSSKQDSDESKDDKKESKSASTGIIDTGNLSEKGNGYEGIDGTGKYNYGEALQKALLFYELQRSGDIPDNTRCNWRGDSSLNDGSDNGIDLSGGWYDAGDNVKFNLPMSYSSSMLGWSIYEDKKAYEESGQLEYALGNIKWANDYFIKCHPDDEIYYYQVGNGSQDHTWWGAAELVEVQMERPSYCVTKDAPGSAVCGETSASLAICSILYKDIDPEYSKLCLTHAKSLYKFAEDTKSDAGYTMAAGFYDSWSGFYDELSFAGAWLYLATDDDSYLKKAKEYYTQANQDYIWAMCWDDVHIGAAVMLARITNEKVYMDAVEKHLDWWTTGTADGERITYTPKGLAWLDSWGSLRYATTTSYIAAVYSQWEGCDSKKSKTYWDFAESQVNYALGDTGFSYEIGFGEEYPVNPHHRTAQGSYCDNMNEPQDARHTLYGALVGGPDSNDGYTDEVSNYNTNEVACDYNAGFVGILAKMYSKYHGKTLISFGAVEPVTEDEMYVDGAVNVDGQDFIEVKAYVYNVSAWPARATGDLELRYYIDLSEVYAAGGSASDIEVTTNYMQAGSAGGINVWDEDKHIYYLSVMFDKNAIYPGGQEKYKKEIQVRLRNPEGAWDNSNDPSYSCLNGNEVVRATSFALYNDGELVYGAEPASGKNAGKQVGNVPDNNKNDNQDNNKDNDSGQTPKSATATSESVELKIQREAGNSISGSLDIKNTSDGSIALKNLEIDYYFTDDNKKDMAFSCYHAAVQGNSGSYTGLNGCKGNFAKANGQDADTVCKITFSDNELVEKGDTLTVNFCINYSDWSSFNTGNDYSGKDPMNIVIKSNGKVIFGNEP